MLFLSLIACFLLSLTQWAKANDYHEELLLRPLPQSALLAAFNFRSNTTYAAYEEQNYRLFPRSLGQILQHAKARELHLRFSLGRWDAETWGARPRGGRREGGTGVELWAWLKADTEEEANARWLTLTNALSGLFCASLNFIDSTKTIRPASTFALEGSHGKAAQVNLHLLHGVLPHEVVCTENLTPFLKLLPCKGKTGISTLLDGHKLFDASWQTMAIDVRPICPDDGSECLLQIEQTVDMVLDVERSMRPQHDPIPRPLPIEDIACNTSKSYDGHDTCYPVERTSEHPWSLKEVFGRPIRGACPLANGTEAIHIEISSLADVQVNTKGAYRFRMSEQDPLRHYMLPDSGSFDLALPAQPLLSPAALEQPRLYAERTIVGHGQERGGLRTVLNNPSTSDPVEIVYLESLPWFMKPYLHTLVASVSPSSSSAADPVNEILYRPSIDRHHGSHIELRLTIPAASTVTLTYDFEKAILRYTEYPPDANRGFDVAPAIIRLLPSPGDADQLSTYLRTTSLLLPLPTPDFSMPYNVIILTSTVIAMAFGSVFNLLVRRFVAADEVEEAGLKVVLARVRERVRGRIVVVRDRFGRRAKEREKKVQ